MPASICSLVFFKEKGGEKEKTESGFGAGESQFTLSSSTAEMLTFRRLSSWGLGSSSAQLRADSLASSQGPSTIKTVFGTTPPGPLVMEGFCRNTEDDAPTESLLICFELVGTTVYLADFEAV